jgi:hypothetical protein
LRESAGCRIEQAGVARRLRQDAFHEFQAERRCGANEIRIVVGGESRSAGGKCVAEAV